jgi:hypothetical protein
MKNFPVLICFTLLVCFGGLAGLMIPGEEAPDPKPSKPLKYTYGAKFEPPEGRVIHGMGQWRKDNLEYLDMLGDDEINPLFRLTFFNIKSIRPWDYTYKRLEGYLTQEKEADRVPFISMGMRHVENNNFVTQDRDKNVFMGLDARVANSDEYDERLKQIADLLVKYEEPVFFRIGGEFNGSWNDYHPYIYPKAFRKVVNIFRQQGADNVAFVWCYEPAAADDFDMRSRGGEYKWFPGEDVVDWFGIDVFKRHDFSAAFPTRERAGLSPRGRTERFLKMARKYKKPVVIAESSAVDVDILSDEAWDEWFEPYFSFIEKHPEIKAFVYVNANWPKYRKNDPYKWKEARISLNAEAGRRYVKEISKKKYLHAGGSDLLNGIDSSKEKKSKNAKKLRFMKSK